MSRDAKLVILQFSGLCLAAMGCMVLTGHLLNRIVLATWGSDSDMAPPTAICFLIVGISKTILASALKTKRWPQIARPHLGQKTLVKECAQAQYVRRFSIADD